MLWRRWRWTTARTATRKFLSSLDKQALIPGDLLLILEGRMSSIEARYAQLSKALVEPNFAPSEIATMNKELHKLEMPLESIKVLRSKQKDLESLNSLLTDQEEEMRRLALEEMQSATKELADAQHDVLQRLLPKDDADDRGCIIEVRAGAGGDEASLFASNLFRMYERYSVRNGWKFEVIDITTTDSRGYKEATASVTGGSVYGKLKFESGVHRVQRVPVTEKAGRIHTSTASVVVLPEANEVDLQVRNEDLRIDTYRSGGAGGQHVNTTNSAVRITHVPTGLVVAIQDERSQHKNKARALQVLYARLYELERSRAAANRSELRQDQIGTGDRSERIRTYNFPQGRVTDHRVGITQHSIEQIMEGEGLDNFVDALKLQQEADALASLKATAVPGH